MVIRRLAAYLKPHRKSLLIAFLLLLCGTMAEVWTPKLVQIFIDDYLTPGNFDSTDLTYLAVGFILLHIAAAGFNYFQLVMFNKIAQWIVQQLRIDVFGKVQHLGLEFFDRTPAGSLVSRITNDTEAVKELFVSVLSTFLQNTVFLVGVFAMMFYLDVKLASYCLLFMPVVLGIMWLYRHFSTKIYHISRQKLSQLNAKLNESISGMNIIQAFRQEQRLRKDFSETNQEHYMANVRNIRLNGLLLRPIMDMMYLLAIVLVLYFFGNLSQHSVVEVGVLYAFINYIERFFQPVIQMMLRLSQMQQALVSAERVFELLDDERMAPTQQGESSPEVRDGWIEFNNVSFSYDGETDVLKNISFTAKPGQTVALVGHTGSGKSSIINLLMRFYPNYRGEISIDGASLSAFTDEELRKKVGLVLQDPFLFVGDVKGNIRLANDEITEEQIYEAAQFVQADSFIQKLPKGYDEPVVERGATFSSGQRQLLSFARTIALNPKVLVLDEATASVDTETEEAIQEALEKMRKGRTTIAIAHRLSTIQDADLILVLHRGEIVERGTHQELLAMQGLYHKMFLLQLGGVAS
ncbi:ABC transporter ATP-binding protein [Tumebacillus permanentifrigoris]|uniref:ATP-binding cassette subfamily B protein n=1 Tax=Tumebacillus permanentifrigoris TaxID=378543 RepID=A0A316DED8_9BACL|nr:ABC transporter transmembrane domain-containing protein [Tumebacillus permanentifrigoris]PWK16394.1 ATP-binding cassette subfamily B protein [Tumebacillus permanentifrigoris]